MKKAMIAVVAALVVLPSTALADKPEQFSESLVGEEVFACGERVLTGVSGSVSGREHRHATKDGLTRVIFSATLNRLVLEDQQGNRYRANGSVNGNFTTPNPDEEGGEVGHVVGNFVIRGEDGFKGKLKLRFFNTPGGGREVEMITGDCEFIEE